MAAASDARLAEAFAHCHAIVREADPDRAVATLFAQPDRRPFLSALYAFDIETGSVRDRVSQPLPGEIRLQWWRDRIEASGQGGEGHGSPVAIALSETIRRHDLPLAAFQHLLEARIFDLYDDPMPSREAFEAYAGETASTLMTLAAMVLDRTAAPSVATIAGHAGVAELAARTLAAEALHRRRGQVFLPADLLAATGLNRAGWLEGEERAEPAREAMRALGREHLGKVEAGWARVPRPVRPAFLPAGLLARKLAGGEAPGPLSRSWRYWRAMRSREESR